MRGERGETTLVGLLVGGAARSSSSWARRSRCSRRARSSSRDAQVRADQQERVRVAVDGLTKQLRNLASPTPDQPDAVDRATGRDLIFKTVDPVGPNTGANGANVKRMRYCLDGRRPPVAPAAALDGRDRAARRRPRRPAPARAGTRATSSIAETVVNDDTGEPVFRFNSTTLSAITRDPRLPARRPRARQGARARPSCPAASSCATRTARPPPASRPRPAPRRSSSTGRRRATPRATPLTYIWKDNGTEVGRGIVLRYKPAKGSHPISLEVQDPAGLSATQGPTTVTL